LQQTNDAIFEVIRDKGQHSLQGFFLEAGFLLCLPDLSIFFFFNVVQSLLKDVILIVDKVVFVYEG
jgi:hypothetical protein